MEMSGSVSDIHVHLYIVVQVGMSSICEDGTTNNVSSLKYVINIVRQQIQVSLNKNDTLYGESTALFCLFVWNHLP
jgi:hypothetical protein